MPPEPGVREPVCRRIVALTIEVTMRTQWECDHWIAEYHGETANGDTEQRAIDRLCGRLELKRWRIDA